MSKDIDICKRVILDTIEDLKVKEDETEFAKNKCKYMEQRLVLLKSLEIIVGQAGKNTEYDKEFTFTCDCCGEVYNMNDRNILFSRELGPDCYI